MEKAVLNRALRRFSSPLLNEELLPKDIQVEVDNIKELITSILAMSDGIISLLIWFTDENEVALMADDTACMLQDFVMKQKIVGTIKRVKSFFYYYSVFLRLKRLKIHLIKIKGELELSEKSFVGIVKNKQVHAKNFGIEENLKRQQVVTPTNSAENCINILMQEALVDTTSENLKSLLIIGNEIIQQCDYSPEMVKFAGEILRFRPEKSYWQAVVDSSVLCSRSDFCLLDTSLKDLPWQLKAFHAYDLLFPDKGVFKERLVELWISEGIVSTAVEIEKYFFGLKDNKPYFDRQNNYLQGRVLSDFSFLETFNKYYIWKMRADSNESIPKKCRYLALICNEHTTLLPPASKFRDNRLHTLLLVKESTYQFQEKVGITHVREDTLSCLVHLRVLDLSSSEIQKLPDSIGKLLYLSYLNLSNTNIEEIPKSIGNLWRLKILNLSKCEELVAINSSICKIERLIKLDLEGCLSLCELPDDLHLMKRLKHLNILRCPLLCMPRQMGNLTQLRFLPRYIVSSEEGKLITELQGLHKLKGELCIENLCQILNPQEALEVRLHNKTNVAHMVLDWSDVNFTGSNYEIGEAVLDNLRPPSLIQKFEIISYPGKIWPSMYFERFMALREFRLINCKEVNTLPPLGQLPWVRSIEIRGLDSITTVDNSFYGNVHAQHAFPKLLELTISQMPNLETWPWPDLYFKEAIIFPILGNLKIVQCPKLKALHFQFPCVDSLTLSLNNKSLLSTPEALKGLSQCLKKLTITLCYELISTSLCVGLHCLTNLEELSISECDQLIRAPDDILPQMCHLQRLTINNSCINLKDPLDWPINMRAAPPTAGHPFPLTPAPTAHPFRPTPAQSAQPFPPPSVPTAHPIPPPPAPTARSFPRPPVRPFLRPPAPTAHPFPPPPGPTAHPFPPPSAHTAQPLPLPPNKQ